MSILDKLAETVKEDDMQETIGKKSIQNSEEEAPQIECLVTMQRIMYPKEGYESGDFAIVNVRISEVIAGAPRIHPIYKTVTLKGNMCKMREGATYKVFGKETYDEKYRSYGYEVTYSQEVYNFTSIETQKAFLSEMLTDKQIGAIYQAIEDPIKVMEERDADTLCKAKGVGVSTAESIIQRYHECKDYSKAFVELQDYGLTTQMVYKLVEHYRSVDTVVDKVKSNPYILATEIDGIGFKKADEIALQGGHPYDSVHRCKAFILYYLEEKGSSGDSFAETDEVIDAIYESLGYDYPDENIGEALRSLSGTKLWHNSDKTFIGLRNVYEVERKIAQHLTRLNVAENMFNFNDWENKLKAQEDKQGWTYTDEQTDSIRASLESNVALITGYAGTGKSSSVAGVLSVLDHGIVFHQTALSGKASVNLTDVTGVEGHTIHRLLGYKPSAGFLHNEDNPLATDLVILDEFSMVDAYLLYYLLQAIPTGAKLIMLGDAGQLESIGVGNAMYDIMESGVIKHCTLTKVHRQASKSAIITKSIDVRNSKHIVDAKFTGRVVMGELEDLEVIGFKDSPYRTKDDDKQSVSLIVEKFKELYAQNIDINDIQVILPTKERGTSCYKINLLLQKIVIPTRMTRGIVVGENSKSPYTLYVGDKVINRKNDYKAVHFYMGKNGFGDEEEMKEEKQVFNGNMGTVVSVDAKLNRVVVDFENIGLVTVTKDKLHTIELGYAITCHSAQGSGIPYVICVVDYTHYQLLTREMIYTMLTRAKKHCVLICETRALRKAIETTRIRDKNTFLPYFLDGSLDINTPCRATENK